MPESRRYLGLDLAGAKNQKTALTVLEHYPKQKKTFVLDVFDRIGRDRRGDSHEIATPHGPDAPVGDKALLDLLSELRDGCPIGLAGVNVPLELPPCVSCTRKTCPMPANCTVPAVKWMRQATRKAARDHDSEVRVLDFTPYTQRPVELWVRYSVFPELPEWARFEIDETLGGNRAPLTARMHFLKRHVADFDFVEVWPKLSLAILAESLGLHKRTVSTYRHLEQGAHSRELILDKLVAEKNLFVYERDLRKLANSLPAFDSFICAYTAMLSDSELCSKGPKTFPATAGWVEYPELK